VSDTGTTHGSLIGLRTALKVANGADVLLVAWDMPFVSPRLLELIQSLLTPAVWVAVPESAHRLEPCCAAYSHRCLAPVERAIAAGASQLGALIDELPTVRRIGQAELAKAGDPERLFFNINSASDLAQAEQMARRM
jgi:molybdopterin-guanine dinucleotide biosynthesis protein A